MSTTLTPPIGVRLPEDLRKYVEQQAKQNFRSVSAEAAMRIERTRQQDLQSSSTNLTRPDHSYTEPPAPDWRL